MIGGFSTVVSCGDICFLGEKNLSGYKFIPILVFIIENKSIVIKLILIYVVYLSRNMLTVMSYPYRSRQFEGTHFQQLRRKRTN